MNLNIQQQKRKTKAKIQKQQERRDTINMNRENLIIDDEDASSSNKVIITSITWNPDTSRSYITKNDKTELPDQFVLDLPENVINQANKKGNNYADVVESFVYNFLTRKFGHEAYHCQIWLPLSK